MPRVPPIQAFIRRIPGDYMTLKEVSAVLQLSEDSLRTWRRKWPERFGPSMMTYYGQMPIYLYNLQDLERVQREAKIHLDAIPKPAPGERVPGRPRIWTTLETQERRKRRMKVIYWRHRAETLRERGDRDGARAATKRWRAIDEQLRREYRTRRRSLG